MPGQGAARFPRRLAAPTSATRNTSRVPRVSIREGPEGILIGWRGGGGQVAEFEQVALVHLDALYRAALRLTRNRAEAEDVVQETCLRAFRSFDRFNPGTNCRAWLFTIQRNVFLNRLRSHGREVLEAEMSGLEAAEAATEARLGAGNPEEEFLQTVLHGDIDRALKTLPLRFREAVVLVDLEGLSYREVAEVLGCPIGTVMSRLSRGRALLRQALARFAREHGYVKGTE
jgi:RNA polymerase sigma-70 factor, ECF subfamily